MKRPRTLCAALILAALTTVSVSGGVALGQTGTPPDIAVSLATDQPLYRVGDPIPAVLYLQNRGAEDVYTFQGFSGQPFYLYLTFQGPDGKGITAPLLEETIVGKTHVPPPKVILVDEGMGAKLLQVEAIETLAGSASGAAWSVEVPIPDLTLYYSLHAGEYLVKTRVPMRTHRPPFLLDAQTKATYKEMALRDWEGELFNLTRIRVTEDKDGDGYYAPFGWDGAPADCDDVLAWINPGQPEVPNNNRDDDCNPATPDLPSMGTVLAQVDRHVIGAGSHPGSVKIPIPEMFLSVFDKSSGSCVARYGVSWQHYADIWANCTPVGQGATDASGRAEITIPPGEYLLIGLYISASDSVHLYVGNAVGTLGAEETIKKYLQVLEKADGKKSAGKSTIVQGSELMIIEPEYVEWTGTQELYPFVFESLDEWGVATSIAPPSGFVADYPALSAEVQGDTQVVQFTVTDVGSEWKKTKVKHKIKHKGSEFVLKTRIGVKNLKDKDKDKGKKK